MGTPALSVVIPVHNGAHYLDRCFAGIATSRFRDFEVVVVDDASTDDLPDVLRRHPDVRSVRNETPRGAGGARNVGVEAARADRICFIDSDIVVREETFAIVDRRLSEDGVDGVVGMLDKTTEGTNFPSRYENDYMHFVYREHAEEMDILYTSIAAIHRAPFEAVGGFDENYRGAGIEDMELGQRLVKAGYRLRLDHSLRVYHLKRFGWRQLLRINRRKATGSLRIMLRNRREKKAPPTGADLHVGPDLRFLAGIPATGAMLVAALAAWWWPWAGWVALALGLTVLTLNFGFLSFMRRERGIGFALAAIPFLLVQFVNYGIGLVIGLAGFVLGDEY